MTEDVRDEICRLILRAVQGNQVVRTGEVTRRVCEAFPEHDLSKPEIAQLAAERAVRAGLAVQFSPIA